MKTSNYIANFLAEKGVKHIFTISGAGNVHLLDAIADNPKLKYICPHHEQAGIMSAIAYGRISGRMGVMITTSGGGASNAITGVLDAWADSMPVVVISGQEKTDFAREDNPLRMWGVQGFNVTKVVGSICKYSALVRDPKTIRYHLEKAFYLAKSGRPGPVWIDIPIDIQSSQIDPDKLEPFTLEQETKPDIKEQINKIIALTKRSKRPVLHLGHGIRLSGGVDLIPSLMKKLPFPVLTAWNGADMIPTQHPLHYGREGNYGQRCANFVVQNCDLLIAIGTRLTLPMIGYDFSQFARTATKVIVDIDPAELAKFGDRSDTITVCADAKYFMEELLKAAPEPGCDKPKGWIEQCDKWRDKYPLFDRTIHRSRKGFVNSYLFNDKLSDCLGDDEIVVTDMGTALTSTHQCIRLKEKQRIITSTGLGEMGYGLPGAIGACFAHDKKRVILITGDGSMMMNLQELQTIAHHKLPIKIFIYINDGYLTIKTTQLGLFGKKFTASGKGSGVTCPDFSRLGKAFGFKTFRIKEEKNIGNAIKKAIKTSGPVICEVIADPLQPLVPKLSFRVLPDGKMVSPPLEDLYPFLTREQLKNEMLIGLSDESLAIKDIKGGKHVNKK